MIMRLTMTMLITMVTVRNTVVGAMPPTRRREKEAQRGFSCNLCGTEFIGDVKTEKPKCVKLELLLYFKLLYCQTEKAKWPVLWPSNGDSSRVKVHFKSHAKIQLFFVAFSKLTKCISTDFKFASPKAPAKMQLMEHWDEDWWAILRYLSRPLFCASSAKRDLSRIALPEKCN